MSTPARRRLMRDFKRYVIVVASRASLLFGLEIGCLSHFLFRKCRNIRRTPSLKYEGNVDFISVIENLWDS